MALFFLSYDLRKGRDYQKMYDELAKYKAVRVLESLWCFNSASTAATLRDHFKGFIDSDDGLAIIEISDWATWNANGTPQDL
jgi:CRISPR associated protein Cas2